MGAADLRYVVLRLAILAALALSGCEVQPYCLDCFDAGPLDAGRDAWVEPRVDANRAPDGATDAAPDADGCAPLVLDLCNGRDDDCDTLVDEGIDLSTSLEHCGACDSPCAPPHAFGECRGGVCELTACDVEFHDLDGDPTNGCEYRCLETDADDSICDLRDNDCDGLVDEDVAKDTDPRHCGSCGSVCAFAHAAGECSGGVCVMGECTIGHVDLDGSATNGCEYACVPGERAVETCNLRDDDCDGATDEGDPGGGGACGTAVGACAEGVEACVRGAIVCRGGTAPSTETCDGSDEDCDGAVDEGNPEGGRLCGTSTGVCVQGRETCVAGALTCVGEIGPATEACNGLDDDCDGTVDDGDPEGGASCGSDVGTCSAGVMRCAAGTLSCVGGTGPGVETCDGVDQDCDGAVDEGDPGGGGACGSAVGTCAPGVRQCVGGAITCVGAVGPEPGGERCDLLDNDCDGTIDEGNPGGGGACGSSVGVCSEGVVTCSGGALGCQGAVGPTLDLCNTVDDDCDGASDEGYDLMNDPRNCGACGRTCSLPNAVAGCATGACRLVSCRSGYVDLNGDPSDGCEYVCDYAGAEVCNGRDDDCDGASDEGVVPPSNFCNPNGVCAGTSASCVGGGGWRCSYAGSYESGGETRCDALDNDCDGRVDEAFPLVGSSCSNGEQGACLRVGAYACNGAGNGVVCTAGPSGGGAAEICNGVDDDCDGVLDEGAPGDWVRIDGAGIGTRWIMAYEASRPDATPSAQGTLAHRACSLPNRLPWTNVTYAAALSACATVGGSLCTPAEWQRACQTSSSSCGWSFGSSCSSFQQNTCNGNERDADPGMPGDQDALVPSGALPMCYADWGGAGRIHDLSGNAEEWALRSTAGQNPLRGGSYNDVSGGTRCDFGFVFANDAFQLPSVGFRCCRASAP